MPSLAIVPAAGKSERFGSAKLLADLNGEPLLNWTLRSLLDAGVARVVLVTAPRADFSAVKLVKDPRVIVAVNDDVDRGMFSSIQKGFSVASGDPIVVMPADMPFVRSGTIADIVQACVRRQRIIVPVHDDRRGHPIAMPGTLRRVVLDADVSSTLKDALGAALNMGDQMSVGDPGVLWDVDRPEDLE